MIALQATALQIVALKITEVQITALQITEVQDLQYIGKIDTLFVHVPIH